MLAAGTENHIAPQRTSKLLGGGCRLAIPKRGCVCVWKAEWLWATNCHNSPSLTPPRGGHHDDPIGVWLTLAKKDTTEPTSLTYERALDESLCLGWIDGQARLRDECTYERRFTPRRARSAWSRRNVGIVEGLMAEGRMHAAGLAEVTRAKTDGRWEAAYVG